MVIDKQQRRKSYPEKSFGIDYLKVVRFIFRVEQSSFVGNFDFPKSGLLGMVVLVPLFLKRMK